MPQSHWVSIQIRVLHDKGSSNRNQRTVALEFAQHMCFGMGGVENNETAFASGHPGNFGDNLRSDRIAFDQRYSTVPEIPRSGAERLIDPDDYSFRFSGNHIEQMRKVQDGSA